MARYQARRDAGAFEQLVARFLRPALAVARQMLSDRALAEDAVQETFLRLVRRPEGYHPSRPFSPWFYTVLRNVCRDMLRRQARQAGLLVQAAARSPRSEAAPPSDALDAFDLLDALPAGSRAVLELRIVQGMAFSEVAAALGISEEAAKKRAQRGLRRLRELREARPLPGDETRRQGARRPAAEGAPTRLSR